MGDFLSTLQSTADIAKTCAYFATPDTFFAYFEEAWDVVSHQVLKLETRQTYREPEDASWQILQHGRVQDAIAALTRSEDDVALSCKLNAKHVDFIRCRPVVLPLSDYLQWEMASYKHSEAEGERIFCVLRDEVADLFDRYALHDFMVFDRTVAFVHNYDATGLIQGGWMTRDADHIASLIALYGQVKAASTAFSQFLTVHAL